MKALIKIVILSLALSSLVISCAKKEDEVQQNNVLVERNVRVAKVLRRDFYSGINTTGRIESEVYLNLSPVLPVKIAKINVREGDNVSKDQILILMDDSSLKQAELQLRNLRDNLKRMEELLKNDAIDRKSFEDMETAYLVAKSNYDSLYDNTYIKAPADGQISQIAFKEGELFNQMLSPFLIKMLSFDQMKAVVNLSDKEYYSVKKKMKAEIRVDSFPDRIFDGFVDFISPEADRMSGMFRCEIIIDNKDGLLRHNQFSRAFITTAKSEATLVVPISALVNNSVFVVENGRAVRKTVEIGITTSREIEIVAGIDEAAVVITSGNVGLTENYPVNIID